MSVLLHASARVIVVGITGRFGRRAVEDLQASGTEVVAGVAFGSALTESNGVPVFTSVSAARTITNADASIVYVPATKALDVVVETIEAGIGLVVYPGEGLPVADAIELRACARANGATMVGANTPGIISPGKSKLGFMPTSFYHPGPIGLISRSGSLSYEIAQMLTGVGLGQSTVVGIGGDAIKGLTAAEALELFHEDAETAVIVYLGEIGGTEEYDVADYAGRADAKPVVAAIVGRTAPPGRQMGHAAALVGSYRDGWPAKVAALEAAGASVARDVSQIGRLAHEVLASVATETR